MLLICCPRGELKIAPPQGVYAYCYYDFLCCSDDSDAEEDIGSLPGQKRLVEAAKAELL